MHTVSRITLLGVLALLLVPITQAQVVDADLVVIEEQALGPGTVSLVQSPFINNDGEVGLTIDIDGDDGVFFDGSAIWLNSFALPGDTLSGAEGTMGIGDDGEFIYSPALPGSNDAVWTDLGLLLVEGMPAPGFGMDTLNTFNSRPTMIPNGAAYWIAGYDNGAGSGSVARVLYTSPDRTTGSISIVLAAGDLIPAPGGTFPIDIGSGLGFDYDVSSDGSNHIHDVNLDTGSSLDDGTLIVNGTGVARETFPTGDGDNWDNFDNVDINNAGTYAFSGDTDGDSASDEFIAIDGVIALREGDVVDGDTLGGFVRGLDLNNSGQVLWAWTTNISSSDEILFLGDASDLAGTSTRLVATGDSLDTNGDGNADYVVTDLDLGLGSQGAGALTEDGIAYVKLEVEPVGGGTEVDAVFGFGGADDVVAFDASVNTTTIPAGGGDLTFTGTLTNLTDGSLPVDVWIDATGPINRTIQLASGTLPAGFSITRSITLGVPGGLPAGSYEVDLNVGDFDTDIFASESFTITKDGAVAGAGMDFTVSLDVNDSMLSAVATPTAASRATPTELTAYPNPFEAGTTFSFGLDVRDEVRLAVYDVLGREVAVLLDGPVEAGTHDIALDARGLASGTYIYRLTVGDVMRTGRVTLVR